MADAVSFKDGSGLTLFILQVIQPVLDFAFPFGAGLDFSMGSGATGIAVLGCKGRDM